MEQDFEDMSANVYEPPKWLDEALRQVFDDGHSTAIEFSEPSEAFRERCREAANVALTIARLRSERRRIGFVPISLVEYIEGLVKVTGVQIDAVLARFGIDDIRRVTADSVRNLARLAQELNISLREVLIHVRIGFVEKFDSAPVPLLLARHRSAGPRTKLEECEAILGTAEAEYDRELLNELRRTEFEIRAAYKEGDSWP